MQKNLRAAAIGIAVLLTTVIVISPRVYAGSEKNAHETSVKATPAPKGCVSEIVRKRG